MSEGGSGGRGLKDRRQRLIGCGFRGNGASDWWDSGFSTSLQFIGEEEEASVYRRRRNCLKGMTTHSQ